MRKLFKDSLDVILMVLMPSGAYARGGPRHLFVPTTKPITENIQRRRPLPERVPCTTSRALVRLRLLHPCAGSHA